MARNLCPRFHLRRQLACRDAAAARGRRRRSISLRVFPPVGSSHEFSCWHWRSLSVLSSLPPLAHIAARLVCCAIPGLGSRRCGSLDSSSPPPCAVYSLGCLAGGCGFPPPVLVRLVLPRGRVRRPAVVPPMRYGDTSATQLTQRLATQSEDLAGDHIGSFDEAARGPAPGSGGGGSNGRPASSYLPLPLELTARPVAGPAGARAPAPAPALPSTIGADPTPSTAPLPSRQPRRRIRSAPGTRPPPLADVRATAASEASATLPWTAVTPTPGASGPGLPLSSAGPAMAAAASSPLRPGKGAARPVGSSSPGLSLVSPPRGQRRVWASASAGGASHDRLRAPPGVVADVAAAPPPASRSPGPALVASAPSPGRPRTSAAGGRPAPSNWPRRRPRQQRLELVPVPESTPANRDEGQPVYTCDLRKRPRRSSPPPPPTSPPPRRGTEPGGGSGSDVASPGPSDVGDLSDASVDDALTAAAERKARGAEEDGVGDEDDFADEVLNSGRKVAERARRARLGLRSRSSSPPLSGTRSSASSASAAGSRSCGEASSSSGRVRQSKRRLVLSESSDSDASPGG